MRLAEIESPVGDDRHVETLKTAAKAARERARQLDDQAARSETMGGGRRTPSQLGQSKGASVAPTIKPKGPG